RYVLFGDRREWTGILSGKLRRQARDRVERPAVGDWVAIRVESGTGPVMIEALLPRRTVLLRKAAGEESAQVLAANLDTVFVVASLNQDFNPARIDRYLAAIRDGGAGPVLILSKADLAAD